MTPAPGRRRFLVTEDGNALVPDVLAPYESDAYVGAVSVNWRLFGSSGHVERPGSVLGHYNKCARRDLPLHNHVKQIMYTARARLEAREPGAPPRRIRPSTRAQPVTGVGARRAQSVWMGHPHNFIFLDGVSAVNLAGERVKGTWHAPPVHRVMWLNHYVTQSRADYEAKLKRGAADGASRDEKFWRARPFAPVRASRRLTLAGRLPARAQEHDGSGGCGGLRLPGDAARASGCSRSAWPRPWGPL